MKRERITTDVVKPEDTAEMVVAPRAVIEALSADAARYRWLRTLDDWIQFQGYLENDPPERLDEYIDKLRSAANAEFSESNTAAQPRKETP